MVVNLTFADRARVDDYIDFVPNPTFLGLSDETRVRDWAVLGSKVKTFRPVANIATSTEIFKAGATRVVEFSDLGLSRTLLYLVPRPTISIAFDVVDSALSDDVGVLKRDATVTIVDTTEAIEIVNFLPPIPFVREPVGDEVRGTVNFARNPNLESDAVALTDWAGGAGIDLTRTSAATPWTGTYSARAAVSPGSDARPVVAIRSQPGLGITGYGKRWIGSVELRGDAIAVELTLHMRYRDGSTTSSEPVVIDTDAEVPLTDTWARYTTDPVTQDGVKTLDYLELSVAIQNDPFIQRIVRIDAVQFEDAVTGSATHYTDGDQGEGYWWVGAPDFSMSVRDTA